MLVVSDNLNLARRHVATAIEKRDGGSIRELAHKIEEAGADVIDVNIGLMTSDPAGTLVWLVDTIQEVTDLQLSLDAHTAEAAIAGADRAKKPPILNAYYLQSSHPDQVQSVLLPYAVKNNLELILPTMSDGAPPLDPDARAAVAVELVDMALAAGMQSDKIYVDPVVVHLLGGNAQAHAVAVLETMKRLPRLYDPPVKTIAGVEYLSQGHPSELRSAVNRAFLGMLAALDLTAAMVDVLDSETMRDIRLIKALRNESLYSVSDAELK